MSSTNSTSTHADYPHLSGFLPHDGERSNLMPLEAWTKHPDKNWAGVIAPGYVLLDFDRAEDVKIVEALLDEFPWKCHAQETSKGLHLVFRDSHGVFPKDATGAWTVLGLKVDIKRAGSLQFVRKHEHDEKLRPVFDPVPAAGEYDEVPDLFRLTPAKDDPRLVGLGDGGGRNDALFTWQIQHMRAGLSVERSRAVAKVINDHVFSVPMPPDEFAQVTRDQAYAEIAHKAWGEKFQHNEFAKALISSHHVGRLDGIPHLYRNGVYESVLSTDALERAMTASYDGIREAQRREVRRYILTTDKLPELTLAAPHLTLCGTTVVDLRTRQTRPASPSDVFLWRSPVAYRPEAAETSAGTELNGYLDTWTQNDAEVKRLILELVGYTLFRDNSLAHFAIFTGPSGTGKSTMLRMIQNMLGSANVSSVDLGDLGDRFNTGVLHGMAANLGDDVSAEHLTKQNVSILKKLSTGDSVKGEFKGKDVFSFTPRAKLLFSANALPTYRDDALRRRMLVIPFEAIREGAPNRMLPRRLAQAEMLEALMSMAVEAFSAVLANKGVFTEPERVKALTDEYERQNDPVKMFLQDHLEDDFTQLIDEPSGQVYSDYTEWALANGYREMKQPGFTERIKKLTGLRLKQDRHPVTGKNIRVYDAA